MSNVNNQFKELINEAIHNHFNDKTETEVILKDWLHGICEQLDEYEKSKHRTHVNDCKAEAFDLICEAMDYHYPTVNDRKYLNGYQHPKASLKDIDAIINSYESGESD